jgi:hypothetical protein
VIAMRVEPEETFITATVTLLAEGVAMTLFLAMIGVWLIIWSGA